MVPSESFFVIEKYVPNMKALSFIVRKLWGEKIFGRNSNFLKKKKKKKKKKKNILKLWYSSFVWVFLFFG